MKKVESEQRKGWFDRFFDVTMISMDTTVHFQPVSMRKQMDVSLVNCKQTLQVHWVFVLMKGSIQL